MLNGYVSLRDVRDEREKRDWRNQEIARCARRAYVDRLAHLEQYFPVAFQTVGSMSFMMLLQI
jgi:hypothetical protein